MKLSAPIYHLKRKADRIQCVAESLRVLKQGGIFAFAYINRNALYISDFCGQASIQNRNAIMDTGENGVFYGMNFGEPQELVSRFPLQRKAHIGVDGLVYPLKARLNEASQEEFAAYMEYHLATCEEPSLLGHSMHGLWIGRKAHLMQTES